MKTTKQIMLALILLSTLSNAMAIVITPFRTKGSLGAAGSGASASDNYLASCASGSTVIYALVVDEVPFKTPKVSVSITKNIQSTTAYDPVDGDSSPSPTLSLPNFIGDTFTVTVSKSAYTGTVNANKGPELYSLDIGCGNIVRTRVFVNMIQNQ